MEVTVVVSRLVLVDVRVREMKRALASPIDGSTRPASMTSPMSCTIWLVSWSMTGLARAMARRQINERSPFIVRQHLAGVWLTVNWGVEAMLRFYLGQPGQSSQSRWQNIRAFFRNIFMRRKSGGLN